MVTGTCVSLYIYVYIHTYIHTHILTLARISPVFATPGAMRPGETVGTGIVFDIGTEGRSRG